MSERAGRLCFVDMPFGEKVDFTTGTTIDFDQIFFGRAHDLLERTKTGDQVFDDLGSETVGLGEYAVASGGEVGVYATQIGAIAE